MVASDPNTPVPETDIELKEWLESLEYVYESGGPDRVREILKKLQIRAAEYGVSAGCPSTTPYINTIPRSQQAVYPGNRDLERRIKSIIRWNAMAMVVRANKELDGIGGHISTYQSAATLYEVGFNHFFRGRSEKHPGDIVYFQGHASPGIYSRAFLEGRLSERQLLDFRRETRDSGGLSSYPHPWLMPDFWQFPTVSMGLGPIMAINNAFFNRYLQDRGMARTSDQKVWAFLGDGEMDEPESMGAITLASRERLDNLIFVINCNLQRLDGPVRGNGKIIQELEAAFRGAGWNVIKVIWGNDYDPLFDKDKDGAMVEAFNNLVDGQNQKYSISSGAYVRKHFFGQDARLARLIEDISDEQIEKLRRGGHDPEKVYTAFKTAFENTGSPTVILAQTVKGYGLGEAGEGKNITHQQKKLNEEELKAFRSRFAIPVSNEEIGKAPFYKPPEDSPEIKYLKERREVLGGFLPARFDAAPALKTPQESLFDAFYKGSGDREVATTMSFVQLLSQLLKDKEIGKHIVPIVPDEARTFGMEALFRQVGIYSSVGQLYDPVDKDSLLYYKESRDGAILEAGINEAGSMAQFIAAGTSYATHGVPMIPFYIFYSMFGMQRIGDLIWAAGDIRAKGFMLGGTSGRTTLAGEGLQHQDGNSHVQALPVPNLKAYDPAFAYELAVIIRDGIHRMFEKGENIFYYITVMNEPYLQPAMPGDIKGCILKGLYRYQAPENEKARVHLLGSGSILNESIKARKMLEEDYQIAADVWSVTSYKQLYDDAVAAERWNRLHPDKKPRIPHIGEVFEGEEGVFVAASDYMKVLPATIAKWVPGKMFILSTDGYGRSDGREQLRDHFEVDARYIVIAALTGLAEAGEFEKAVLKKVIRKLKIKTEKKDPATA